ncbi:MAG: ABC transporter permease [Eubacteriaceae bacterium]
MLSLLNLRIKRIKDDIPLLLIMTGMAFLLTFIFGSSFDTGFNPTIAITDNDNSEYSRELIEEIQTIPNYNFEITNYSEAIQRVKEFDTITALIINENFAIEGNGTVDIFTAKESIEGLQFENTLRSKLLLIDHKMRLNSITKDMFEIEDLELLKTMQYDVKNTFDIYWNYKKPITTKLNILSELESNQYDDLLHYLVGFTLFFSTYVLVFGAADILKEKQDYTLQKLLVSPLSKSSIIASNMIVTFMSGFIQVFTLVMLGKYVLNINWGGHVGIILLIYGAFVFCLTSFGMFLSGIIKTHEQLSSITPIVLTSSAMLGGCMWPLEIVSSKLLLFISNLMPHKWALQSIEGIIMHDQPISTSVNSLLVLIGMGLLYFLLGLRVLKVE